MTEAFICDAVRTPIGRYGGALRAVRADDLAAIPIRALKERNHQVDWAALDDIILGCANQAGEDNRNLARMAGLLAGLPDSSAGVTLNRLCGSGLDAVAMAARAIRAGDADLIIAGGSESMSRAPFVMPKAMSAFDRNAEIYDTTIGWRFVNPKMRDAYGDDTMPEHGRECRRGIPGQPRGSGPVRPAQPGKDRCRRRPIGRLAAEIVPVTIPQRKGDPIVVDARRASARDQSRGAGSAEADRPRATARSPPATPAGVNDGAAALIVASEAAVEKYGLTPARPHARRRGRGRSAADHGHRPGPGHQQAARPVEP